MKKGSTHLTTKRLASYSAMAAAFVAVGSDANGAVVYTDIPDETVDIGELFMLDIDGDGNLDLLFQATSTTGGSWSFGRVFGYVTSYTVGTATNALIGYAGAYLPYGSALESGDPIGPGGDFYYNSGGNQVFLASVYAGVTYGPFANETDKYLGVQFVIDGNVHYGWVRLDANVSDVELIIKDMAYDDTPDTEILAGQMTSAVQNQLSEDALTAYSYGNTINVVVKSLTESATVQVVNLAGQVVYSNTLDNAGMQITLDNAATGNYIMHVVTESNSVYTKQMFINN